MNNKWLTKPLTVEGAETSHAVKDKRLDPDRVPFGFQNARWREFISQIQPGDELWASSPPETWERRMGTAGISLVRQGEIVDSIATMMN